MSQQTLNLVNNIVMNAEEKGVAKLVLDNLEYDGKNVIYKGNNLISFGSYSYLGLEVDFRLKQAAIEAIASYGIQYPSSRIYSSLPIYRTLNKLLEDIFQSNVVITTSLSLGHMGVLPIVTGENDLLILDQHVHSSVQDAAQKARSKNVTIQIVRHNDIAALEEKLLKYGNKYEKIWYAIDGIYSMFGDTAPIKEIERLLNKYSNFYVYADDAHGISSFGDRGAGWILSKITLHSKMVLSTGMAKAFGTMGGIFVIPDQIMFDKVNNCTGSLIFSGPHPIPIIGASIKSAEIHLSEEIYERQQVLQEKIRYCYDSLRKKGIPNISERETPIFFIAIGKLNAGYNLVQKMIEAGFLTNLASFPAVSESCTGVRFTITYHHTFEDIDNLIDAFVINYPLVLAEEGLAVEKVRRAFRKVNSFPDFVIDNQSLRKDSVLNVIQSSTIKTINREEWDAVFNSGELFESDTLLRLEQSFKNNLNDYENWDFLYFQIYDKNEQLILSTFFTISIMKDDMISSKHISGAMEMKRKENQKFLTSKVMLMGTQISEGNHVFIDFNNKNWKKALDTLIDKVDKIKEERQINTVIFRDFDLLNFDLNEALLAHGFLKMKLPDSHILFTDKWELEIPMFLSKKKRKYLRETVYNKESEFMVDFPLDISNLLIRKCYDLYKNVNSKSLDINNFDLPFKMFQKLIGYKNWEVICLHLSIDEKPLVAMVLAFVGESSYHPVLIGMDYNYLTKDIYPQTIWQIVKRAKSQNKRRVYLGFTASQNKRKFGAERIEKYAFIKSLDNYNQIILSHS